MDRSVCEGNSRAFEVGHPPSECVSVVWNHYWTSHWNRPSKKLRGVSYNSSAELLLPETPDYCMSLWILCIMWLSPFLLSISRGTIGPAYCDSLSWEKSNPSGFNKSTVEWALNLIFCENFFLISQFSLLQSCHQLFASHLISSLGKWKSHT